MEDLHQESEKPRKPIPESYVTANGLKIQSKLNPEAKEFYPLHITRRNQVFQEILKEPKSTENRVLEEMHEDATKEPNPEPQQGDKVMEKQQPEATQKQETVRECDGDEINKKPEPEVSVEGSTEKSAAIDLKTTTIRQTASEVQEVIESKVCGDCPTVTANNEPTEEKVGNEVEAVCETLVAIKENREDAASDLIGTTHVDDEVEALIKEIEDEIKAENKSATAAAVEVMDPNEKDKSEVKEETGIKRKISKIALGPLKKPNHHPTTTAEKQSTQRIPLSMQTMTRTKRISESLHNLSTTLKSKTDPKKPDSAGKVTPRSSTTTNPKATVRSRTLLSKGPVQVNGLKKEPPKPLAKDAISLRSTSSTEKSIASKSSLTASTHSVSSKSLYGKLSATSTKSSEGKLTLLPTSKNSKDSSQKLPRSTLSSSLRQTEAQKTVSK